MIKLFLAMVTVLSASVSTAHGTLPVGGAYYVGQQPVGIVGDVADCFVEAVFSTDGSNVEVRALVADPHDGALIGKGVVKADYSEDKNAYYFSSMEANAPIQEMVLNAVAKKTAEGMGLTFLDGGHYDRVSCDNLTAAKDAELSEVEEMFEHFDDYTEEAGGDEHGEHEEHDADHQHEH